MEAHLIQAGIPVSEEEHMKRIKYKYEAAQIILLAGQAIGLLKVVEHNDHIEIVQFQVLSSFRGKGIGKQVLVSLLEKASAKELYLSLSVLKGNKAKELYLKLGFQIVGETEDSIIMQTS